PVDQKRSHRAGDAGTSFVGRLPGDCYFFSVPPPSLIRSRAPDAYLFDQLSTTSCRTGVGSSSVTPKGVQTSCCSAAEFDAPQARRYPAFIASAPREQPPLRRHRMWSAHPIDDL